MNLTRTLGIAALMLASASAFAGLTQGAVVTVDLTTRFAGGDMVTARFAANDVEFIGCGIRAFDDGAGGATWFGFCQAADADDVRAFCNTSNPELLDAIKATADFSYVTFSWNESDECTRIGFSTQSFYIPDSLEPTP